MKYRHSKRSWLNLLELRIMEIVYEKRRQVYCDKGAVTNE